MNLMQHGEKEQVYCIETKKSDGGRQCVGARKGMSEKGEECFLPYLRAWTHNDKMLYEEEKEQFQSKQVGFTLDKQRREARKSE